MKNLLLLFLFVTSLAYAQQSDFSATDFKKADSIALHHKGASLTNLPVLTHVLTSNLETNVEKFRAIYTWVSTNIENDYSGYLKTSKKRKKLSEDRDAFLLWNASHAPKMVKKLVSERKAACTGYAYLLKEMTSLAGINCKIINGFGRTATLNLTSTSLPNHSWNAVELNNKWYLCDPTWSAGRIVFEENMPSFKSDYFDGYFLASPSIFIKNHYPLEKNWTLLATHPTFREFLDGPVVYKEIFKSLIVPITPSKMHLEVARNKKINFELSVAETSVLEHLNLVIDSGNSNKEVKPKIKRNLNSISLEHTFTKKGLYDVHLRSGDTYIATYVVKVNRE